MKKFIAPVALTAAALTLVAPLQMANAAQLTKAKDQDGVEYCRIDMPSLTLEKVAADKAGRYASTLTVGAEAIAIVDGVEAAVPGAKAIGDEYIRSEGVLHILWEPRGAMTNKAHAVQKARAEQVAIAKLVKLGLKETDAGLYLRKKEMAQNPEHGEGTALAADMSVFIGIAGGRNKIVKFSPERELGRAGQTLAKSFSFDEGQKQRFVANVNDSYYGKVRNLLESSYVGPLERSVRCLDGQTHEIFPTSFEPGVTEQRAKNAELPKPEDAIIVPEVPAPNPAPEKPEPEKPAPRPNANADGSSFDAELAKVIGIIATVLAALGALFGLLQTMGVKGLPEIPQIPGNWL